MKAQFIYDKETDSLAVFTGRRTRASVELGSELIVDLGVKNDVTGVEFINSGKLLKLSKKALQGMSRASLASVIRGGVTWICVSLTVVGLEKEIRIPLTMAGR